MPCRNTAVREGNIEVCLVCRKPIGEGQETKKLNRGRKHGVRHLACPYVVDLTGPLEAVEAPAATRNEDLFPTDCRGSKRAAPAGSGNDSPRDPRLRRTTER